MSTRAKLEDIHVLAANSDCSLLTTKYINCNQKLDWKCNECTHVFKKTLATVKNNGLKCPKCSPRVAWNKGKQGVSKETSAKMRAAKIGHQPWNKGKNTTIKQRIKISCSTKGISVEDFNGFYDRPTEANKYANKRYKQDPQYKLAKLIRNKLYRVLTGGQSKTLSDNIGCTIEELKAHLESKFQDNMSWANHGLWHIDHIVPLSNFDLTDEKQLKKAWHYSNLQPLWAEDNLYKSNKQLKSNTLYILTGNFGVGKTHILNNLSCQVINADKVDNVFIEVVKNIDNGPLVVEIPVGVSTFINRYGHMFNYRLMVVDDSSLRGVNDHPRINRIKKLASNADVVGTREEILNHLSNI